MGLEYLFFIGNFIKRKISGMKFGSLRAERNCEKEMRIKIYLKQYDTNICNNSRFH
jgi:hypothetical protein